MSNAQKGKKILDVLRVVRAAHHDYTLITVATPEGAEHFIKTIDYLCQQHNALCCNKCGQYNDECACQ